MRRYVILEPGGLGRSGAVAERSGDAVFVRDGFSFVAFFLPVVWLLWNRLFLAGVLVLAASSACWILGSIEGFGAFAAIALILMRFLVALEGPSLRLARYRRLGFGESAILFADTIAEAEIRYYAGKEDETPSTSAGTVASAPRPVRSRTNLLDPIRGR